MEVDLHILLLAPLGLVEVGLHWWLLASVETESLVEVDLHWCLLATADVRYDQSEQLTTPVFDSA